MEFNEVRSQLVSLMNFGKISTNTGANGDVFAQLLNGNEDSKVDASVVSREDGRVETSKDSRVDQSEVCPDKEVSANKKKEKTAKKDADVKESKVEADGVSQAVDEKQEDKENGGNEDVSSVRVYPADFMMMETVNVVNPETGEMVQMKGVELAAQLTDETQVFMSVPQEGMPFFRVEKNEVQADMSALLATGNEGAIDVGYFSPVDSEEVFDLNVEMVKAQIQNKELAKGGVSQDVVGKLIDKKIVEQAEKISEFVGRESKVNVNVSVQEEKIAQLNAKDLLADAQIVDEAITVSSKPAVVSVQTSANMLYQSGDQSAANNIQNLNVAPVFNVVTPVSVENVTVAEATANVEVSSVNLGNATVAGGEFVRAARADVVSENNQASFRDVYKGMSKEVVEQVKVNITKSAVKGIDKIDISLKPEDLGHIEIKMQIGKDGKLQAHIISTRPETMEILQKEMQSLEKAFNDAGFQTDEGSLSFSFRDGNQANQNQDRENGLRNFIGDIFEKETSNDLLVDVLQNQSWDGTTGLNIRV